MIEKKRKNFWENILVFFVFCFLLVLSLGVFSALENESSNSSIAENNISFREFSLDIFDAKGNLVDSEVEIFDKVEDNNSISVFSSGSYKEILVKPKNSIIKEIYFDNINLENNTDFIKIDYPDVSDYPQFLDIYAIDPSEFNFVSADVTAVGEGENLMKCKTWNFEERVCEPVCGYEELKDDIICHSGWEVVEGIKSNSEYSFVLSPQDPAFATYNPSFGAPHCDSYESPCIANSSELQCAGTQASPGPEPNQPNTIDSCVDASSVGTCHSDESVENLTIETLNGSMFNAGDTVRVTATWSCYDGTSDRLGFYYSNSSSSPVWKPLTSGASICPNAGFYTAGTTFQLDNVSSSHVVRGMISYNNDITTSCPGAQNSYSEQDDLVFNVAAPNTAPDISLNLPSDLYTFNDVLNVNLNFTPIDDFNSTLICSLYLDSELNSTDSSVSNNTLTNFLVEGVSYGVHNWSVNCSDGSLSSLSEVREFWINDSTAPMWSDVEKNKSSVNFGDVLKFNTTWTDNLELSGFIFSNNDSGSWLNSSYQAFSGTSNISEYVLEINSSVGENVGWYFWANDSYGNSNMTEIQTFNVENISTSLNFNLDNSTYRQGESLYEGYMEYIYFDVRYVDELSNSISGANCVVVNDITSDEVSLDYNESTGNYTGRINNYKMYGNVTFNASCSKDNYVTVKDSDSATVIAYAYLWELDNYTYSSDSNSSTSHWLRRKPTEGSNIYTLNQNFSLSSGENLIYEFPVLGLGKNYSFLRDYNILGEKELKLNLSINDSSCEPFLSFRIRDFNLGDIYYVETPSQSILADTPTIVSGNFSENITIQQGNYMFLELYLNCSSAASENVEIYYNYSGEPANIKVPELVLSEIKGEIVAFYNTLENPLIGPDERLNVTNYINFSLNNTNDYPAYTEYFLVLPIDSAYPNSLIPNTTYAYNSTGGLLASDNDSAGAPGDITITSNNIASWYTEVIPANTAVVEVGKSTLKEQIRNDEVLVSNSSGVIKWNISVYSISSINFGSLEVWTNYSKYGVNSSEYSFNITKTRFGETIDFTNNFSLDTENKTLTSSEITTSSYETVFLVTATDSSSPEVYLVSPVDDFSTAESAQTFTCNISDTSIDSLSFYLWKSGSLYYSETVNLSGVENASNFSYSFGSDGDYVWNCLGVDSQGNSAWSQEGNYTLTYDTTPPSVVINSPMNTTYTEVTQLLDISSDGVNTWYNWNGTNYSYSGALNISFDQGVNVLSAYSNDSLGNLASKDVVFEIIDDIPPTFSSINKNDSNINFGESVMFNTTWEDNYLLAGFIFSNNDSGSWVNSSYQAFSGTSNISEYVLEINSFVGENVGWYFWANDSYGNSNMTEIQTFNVENISTSLNFNINGTSFPQAESLYGECLHYIPFEVEYLDSNNNSISGANCFVVNDLTDDVISLEYNESTGNYTGEMNTYNLYSDVNFNATCEKENYFTAKDNDSAEVITYVYLWEMGDLNYSSNSTSSYWLRKMAPQTSNVYTLSDNFSLGIGENLVYEFPIIGLGKEYSFLSTYNVLGDKYLRLNVSINDSSCEPFLGFSLKDFDLSSVYSTKGLPKSISANIPVVIESNFSDNFTIRQGDYGFLNLYMNCSSAVSQKVEVYYNYSEEPANIEIKEFIPSVITGKIVSIYDDLPAPIIGPNETLNVTEYMNFSLNNTGDNPAYIKYFLALPIDSEYPNSIVPGSAYIYNSTGQLLASDNDSSGAPNDISISSDNIASWFTEVIPANTAVIETGNAVIRDLIRNNEEFSLDSNGEIKWNISVFSISSIPSSNITVWTNYSEYGIDYSNYDFNVTKERSGVVTDITDQIVIDSSAKKISFPAISANNIETNYYVTASDSSSPVVHLVAPADDFSTAESLNFTCNISDDSISSLTFYLWKSGFLYYDETVSLSGIENESNFSYSFVSDGDYVWNCLGVDSQGNSAWSQEGNYTLTYDTTPPSVVINSPVNTTYSNKTQLLDITSDGNQTWYNWNGTNFSYSEAVLIEFDRGPNTLNVYSNDSLGNLNANEVVFYVNSTAPIINEASLSSFAVVNGSNITFTIDSSYDEYSWINISIPGGGVEKLFFDENNTITFYNTSTIGRYAVAFYVNDSFAMGNSYQEYFESFIPQSFNFSLQNSNFQDINSTIEIIYRNKTAITSSGSGDYLSVIPDTIADFNVKSYSDSVQVRFSNFNFSSEDAKSFFIDKVLKPDSKYLTICAINNSYNFTSAILRVYYDDISSLYSLEDNLEFYKCNDYNFSSEECLVNWVDITSSSTQNQESDYFEYNTSSFSAFSIQENIPQEETGSSSGGGGGGSGSFVEEEEVNETDVYNETFGFEEVLGNFSIDVQLKNIEILRFEDLVLLIGYKTFNETSFNIEILFEIYDSFGNLVYSDLDNYVVKGDGYFEKDFSNLNLTEGDYKIFSTIFLDSEEKAKFVGEFEFMKSTSITGKIIEFCESEFSWVWIVVLFVVLIGVLILILIKRNKKVKKKLKKCKKEKKKKEGESKYRKRHPVRGRVLKILKESGIEDRRR